MLARPDDPERMFPFVLCACEDCGFVQVDEPVNPDTLYNGFNFNFSAWKTEPHIDDEAALLCARCNFTRVLDIGCNDGRFLTLLRDRGAGSCLGIEPNSVGCERARARGLEVVNAMLTGALAQSTVRGRGRATLLVTRQVIEHVIDVNEFLSAANALIETGGHLFVDLPDSAPAFKGGDCSILWEEHVGYYTTELLQAVVESHGFAVEEVRKYDFSGGCVAVLARKISETRGPMAHVPMNAEAARTFSRRVSHYSQRLREFLARVRSAGVRIVLYGVGVRGCTVANFLKLGPWIDRAVDDQPERQGMYMPGLHLLVEPFAAIAAEPGPLLVLLAVNNENDAVVTAKIKAIAGDRATVMTVCGPADIGREIDKAAALVAARFAIYDS